jgi:hypothetical protein
MDTASNSTRTSEIYFRRIKRAITIFGIFLILILEIYACYFISSPSDYTANTRKFTCGRGIKLGNNLSVNICDKLIKILQVLSDNNNNNNNNNSTLNEVTLSDIEWNTLAQLLR